jgi:hypothetical protein
VTVLAGVRCWADETCPTYWLTIFRPSLLVGERVEARLGERVGIKVFSALAPLMIGPARKIRPVEAKTVAQAMIATTFGEALGVTVVESDAITN